MQHLFWMTPPARIFLFPFFLLGLFGLGSCFLPRFVFTRPAERVFLSGCFGTALTQFLVLIGLPIWVSIAVALLGCLVPVARLQNSARVWGLLILSAGPLLMILGENLLGWDARAIWFFQGSLLYDAQNLFAVPWAHPDFTQSHPDYPKAIAILSAQTSTLMGVWNERWPKLALVVLLALTQCGLCATRLSNWRVWLADFLLLAGIGYLMWNGYADGYLAVFAFLAALFFGEYFESDSPAQLWCGLGCVSLLFQTKNEGLALGLILLGLLAVGKPSSTDRRTVIKSPSLWILLLPVATWQITRTILRVHNDLSQGLGWSLPLSRITDPAFWNILATHWWSRGGLMVGELALLLLLAITGLAPRERLRSASVRFPLAAFALYTVVVFLAYLTTYWPLLDHLRSSFSRVAIPLYTLLLAALLGSLPKSRSIV
jgi:hypothetical protein